MPFFILFYFIFDGAREGSTEINWHLITLTISRYFIYILFTSTLAIYTRPSARDV